MAKQRRRRVDSISASEMREKKIDLNELVPTELGGKNFQFKYEPRCLICQKGSEVVSLVNSLLLTGASYRDIWRTLKPLNDQYEEGEKITQASLSRHKSRHMPFDSFVVREALERRAKEQQKDIEREAGSIVNEVSYDEVMMNVGFKNMVEKPETISAGDGLRAARVLHNFNKEAASNQSAVEAMAQLAKIIEAVKAVVTEEQMGQIIERLNSDDTLELEAEEVEEDEDAFDPLANVDEEEEDEGLL